MIPFPSGGSFDPNPRAAVSSPPTPRQAYREWDPPDDYGSGDGRVAVVMRDGGILQSVLFRAPPNEIRPEDDAMKDRKSWQMKPATCRGIGDTGADGKLLGVQGLIQTAFFQY